MSLLHRLARPLIGAPMAGGVSTPALVAAVSEAGGLGMLPAGYRTPEQLASDIVATRQLTERPFGVNLFVPHRVDRSRLESDVQAYREALLPDAQQRQVEPGHPVWGDTDSWADKVALVEVMAPAVVSCTFGVPDPDVLARWKAVGCEVHVTATSAAEAATGEACGADVLILQGREAGGHRGSHDADVDPEPVDHLGLLAAVAPTTAVPLVAAGGITTSGDWDRARAAGASAVQVGTALLLTPESGASATYRAALRDPTLTDRVVTRAFTGRPAGAVRNRFVDRYAATAPAAFPVVGHISKPVRAAAASSGDVHGIHIWAGTGWRACQERPAAEVVRDLVG